MGEIKMMERLIKIAEQYPNLADKVDNALMWIGFLGFMIISIILILGDDK